ncbi:hypothetical protein CYY_008964 [Polysphondylium violaceum]|uniref:Transmembrane protein n=1 Tax=Polysphondylium violaceum TaxID=133409 RepID=A0A8J4PMD3_9MYCE|nr:hypothetical protein CYY_008964 [Polysphondylium violaceum]
MSKLFVGLFITLCICASSSSASDTYGVGIWNNGTNVNVGLVNYSRAAPTILKVVIQQFNFIGDASQISTYNYNTKQLTLVANIINTSQFFLITIDCNTWTIVSKSPISQNVNYYGLESDYSTNGTLFAPTTYGDGLIYMNILDPLSLAVRGTFDYFPGSVKGSVYDPVNQLYYICYTLATNANIRCRQYNSSYSLVQEKQLNVTNSNFQVIASPISLIYNPTTKTITCYLQMMNQYPTPSISYYFTLFDFENSVFNVIQQNHIYGTIVSTASDMNGLRLSYSVEYFNGQYQLWVVDTRFSTLLTRFALNTALLSIF